MSTHDLPDHTQDLRVVYLPCELKSRDLPSRLKIAKHLQAAGYPVILGQWWGVINSLSVKVAPRGVVLFCTANSVQVLGMSKVKAHGCVAIASDEESVPFAGEQMLVNIDPQALATCDLFLAHGETQRAIFAKAWPAYANKITVVGSPRFDEIVVPPRPMKEPYFLFNTSLGIANSTWGSPEKAIEAGLMAMGASNDPKQLAEMKERYRVEESSRAEMIALIRWLTANTKLRVVLRPHPSENGNAWTKVFADAPQVTVLIGSDPLPWIAHATAVIHSDSTTGLEAAMLGVPCLNLSPSEEWSARFVMRQINMTVASANEARWPLKRVATSGNWPKGNIDNLFARGGVTATVAIIRSMFDPPGALTAINWNTSTRTAVQRQKFTASLDEIRASLPSASLVDESVFLLQPE